MSQLVQTYMTPSKRVTHLQTLSLGMADEFLYTQASCPKFSTALKRSAEVLAREAGGTFAKAWKAKAAPSIFSKLFFKRGQVPRGWLTDAVQGRINCESVEAVQKAAAYFQSILSMQEAAVEAAGRPVLGEEPSGTAILQYDLTGLVDSETEKPVENIASFLTSSPPEGVLRLSCQRAFHSCSLLAPASLGTRSTHLEEVRLEPAWIQVVQVATLQMSRLWATRPSRCTECARALAPKRLTAWNRAKSSL